MSGSKYIDDRLFSTAQYEKEWQIYSDILNRTNVTKHTKWLDIKGNHGKNEFNFKLNFDLFHFNE